MWNNQTGEFTDKAMAIQYWISLFCGIACIIIGCIYR